MLRWRPIQADITRHEPMAYGFLDIASTPGVRAAQEANGSGEYWANFDGDRTFDRFTPAEAAFIAERDSFYMATVSESGWPYVQHRGGPPGFIRVLDEKTLAIPDFRGNREYISTGNLAKVERGLIIHLAAFDWNCPQHIVPRFSDAELAPALAPMRARLEALETENQALRAKLAENSAVRQAG